ncbi:hypothetical protein [Bifidobacterium magnum]|uniref:Uncharacterized protein n=1 Tax=Bifidobacterium magnum TaxID=1692 RepID=A0A087BA71_9BIFI|nr:hypothetical protein [Bifidobacterium magnum]KFI67921.1 hypothetical protein BMAGN_0914 [Bifidobacterium magnum]
MAFEDEFMYRPISFYKKPLPSYDGVIKTGLNRNIKFHMVWIRPNEHAERSSYEFAMLACRAGMLAVDVLRRKQITKQFKALASPVCIDRMEYMIDLLQSFNKSEQGVFGTRTVYSPVEPFLVNGMVISERKVEISIMLKVGEAELWGDIEMRKIRNKWLCTVADIG